MLEYNVAITNLSNAIFPTLEKLLESLSSSFLFCRLARDYFLCVMTSVCSLFLTQSKSVITDNIKELLSRKVIISSSCLEVTCNKKEMEC